MGRLEGKVAIVTGGAMGIGHATSLLMAREGARVVVADLQLDAARTTAAQILAAGGQATAMHLDAMSESSIEALVRQTHEVYGALHVLHNNVGGTDSARDTTVVEMDWAYWNTALTLNLSSTVYACRCAIPLSIEGSHRLVCVEVVHHPAVVLDPPRGCCSRASRCREFPRPCRERWRA